ncbi:hypothetical protein D3C81_1273930 [compost metagenome]
MAITIMNADDRFCTDTPCAVTASGKVGSARFTRFCTSTCASCGSVPMSKYTVSVMSPVEELDEFMYIMLSAPLTCCSIGAATFCATTSALAPGYLVLTVMDGGVMSGNCATGSAVSATRPPTTMMIDSTDAKIGRSIKK